MDNAIQSMQAGKLDTILLDQEGAHSEGIKGLQRSIPAYKGHLTREYNELRFLCSNSGSLSEIMSKKSALDDLFARYAAAVGILLQSWVDLEANILIHVRIDYLDFCQLHYLDLKRLL